MVRGFFLGGGGGGGQEFLSCSLVNYTDTLNEAAVQASYEAVLGYEPYLGPFYDPVGFCLK